MAAPRGFMRAVSGLYQVYLRPPYSPPKPHARAARHPCKIHSQHHQHQQTAHTTPPHQPHRHRQHRGQSHTAQHHQHRQTAHTTAPQPAPAHATASQHHTKPGRSARRRRRPARRSPPARPGGRRYSRRGIVRSAGSGAQKFFRYDLFFGLPPGGAGKKKGGEKKRRGKGPGRWGVERGAAEERKNFLEWPTMASFMCYSGSVNNQPTAETLWAFLLPCRLRSPACRRGILM